MDLAGREDREGVQVSKWDDEEFSELAEVLEYACQAAVKKGREISSLDLPGTCSPFGALLQNGRFPYPENVEACTGIPRELVGAFHQGFCGSKRAKWFSVKAYEIGRQFRERWTPEA